MCVALKEIMKEEFDEAEARIARNRRFLKVKSVINTASSAR